MRGNRSDKMTGTEYLPHKKFFIRTTTYQGDSYYDMDCGHRAILFCRRG